MHRGRGFATGSPSSSSSKIPQMQALQTTISHSAQHLMFSMCFMLFLHWAHFSYLSDGKSLPRRCLTSSSMRFAIMASDLSCNLLCVFVSLGWQYLVALASSIICSRTFFCNISSVISFLTRVSSKIPAKLCSKLSSGCQ